MGDILPGQMLAHGDARLPRADHQGIDLGYLFSHFCPGLAQRALGFAGGQRPGLARSVSGDGVPGLPAGVSTRKPGRPARRTALYTSTPVRIGALKLRA
jgi:hypothetical protein